jgi:hypothetical protein
MFCIASLLEYADFGATSSFFALYATYHQGITAQEAHFLDTIGFDCHNISDDRADRSGAFVCCTAAM